MSKKQGSKKYPDAPAGYRWEINDQARFIDVQLVRGDHKKRPTVDAFTVLRLDRDEEYVDSLVEYHMKEIKRGLAR